MVLHLELLLLMLQEVQGALEDGVNGAAWDDPHAAFGRNWVHRANLQEATPRQLYSVALFISLSNIFSGSTGAVQPASPSEYYIQSLMMVLGCSVWAYVIANAVAIFATLNPNAVHYRRMMDELNYFAADKRLPKPMLVKLREFFGQTQHVHRQARCSFLFDLMSAPNRLHACSCAARPPLMTGSLRRAARLDVCSTQGRCCPLLG